MANARRTTTIRAGSRWQPGRPRTRRRTGVRVPRWQPPSISVPRMTTGWRRLFTVALFATGLGLGGWFLYHSSWLEVHDVKVQGTQALNPEFVAAVAGLEGESLILSDLDAARERLLAVPLVKDAQLERDLPWDVNVTIVEREAWGLWQAGGRIYVIDDEGVVLDLRAPDGAPLIVATDEQPEPFVVGDRVDHGAVTVARQLDSEAEKAVGLPLESLEFSREHGLVARLGSDLRVAFGDERGYEFKLATLFAVLRQAEDEGRSLRNVDLRFGDRVAVQ